MVTFPGASRKGNVTALIIPANAQISFTGAQISRKLIP